MRPPRDPKALLVELDALIKVRDIREWEKLKSQVEVKWWESALVALLFISGVGMLVTIGKLVPKDTPLLAEFIMAWVGLFLLTIVACVEFLVLKFRALRRMHEATSHMIDEQQQTLKAIRNYLEARESTDHSGSENK